jgi:acetyl esterase/lipase
MQTNEPSSPARSSANSNESAGENMSFGPISVMDVAIQGYRQTIRLRSYRYAAVASPSLLPEQIKSARQGKHKHATAMDHTRLPIVLYFHGGMFIDGGLDDGDATAQAIARQTPAWVISVGYSLAPEFPFPTALEDGYLALQWAVQNAKAQHADPRRIGVAGHDAGGNLATCLSAIVRDRGDGQGKDPANGYSKTGPKVDSKADLKRGSKLHISAQALLAPLLDPSMTRMVDPDTVAFDCTGGVDARAGAERVIRACAQCYRAYLPQHATRMHPYAAPIESRRLAGLPPAMIASAQNDLLHLEAEKYATALIDAGVPTQVTRHANASHQALASHPQALKDVASFFGRWLSADNFHH